MKIQAILPSLLLSGTALAGVPTEPALETPAPESGWGFRVEPYGWLTGLNGQTGISPIIADFDQSFSDIFKNIDMAAALQFEARKGKWGIIADGFYADLGASATTPGPLYDSASVDISQFIGELYVAYRVYDTPTAFVDLYAGMRYNSMSLDMNAKPDPQGLQSASDAASGYIVNGIQQRASEIVGEKVDEFKTATAAKRDAIVAHLTAAIEAQADGSVKRDLAKQLVRIRHDGGLDARDIATNRITRAVKAERLALARSTARLEAARLRASVDSSLQGKVSQAQARVNKAEQKLAAAINNQLTKHLPTEVSADKDWLDPIMGVRAQWNFHEKWFVAGQSDIGGFGIGSDLAWTAQATAGYQFTENVSAELGYRYLATDYQDGKFTYDVDAAGIYTGMNIKF